jgi:hypothetical protein
LIGFLVALAVRSCAIIWRWSLPGFPDRRRASDD